MARAPVVEYAGERDHMAKWCERKSEADLAEYRTAKSAVSIDGLPAWPG